MKKKNGTIRKMRIGVYTVLIIQAVFVLFPLYTIMVIPFKKNAEIFRNPFSLPKTFSVDSFVSVVKKLDFLSLYRNSFLVTIISLGLVVLFASLASYAFEIFEFRFKKQLLFYFLIGIMIPIRLGVLNLFNIIKALHLFDNILSLILIYIAMSIPISIVFFTGAIRGIPKEIVESARIDGCSEINTFFRIIIPLIKPTIATVVVYNFLPIWNDFYFPLIFIRSDANKTIPLGIALFFGQYSTDWSVAFAALTVGCIPPIIIYLLFSKWFIKGVTAGAVKG